MRHKTSLSSLLAGAIFFSAQALGETPARRSEPKWIAVPASQILEAARKLKPPFGQGTYTVQGIIYCMQELIESPSYRILSSCKIAVDKQIKPLEDAQALIQELKTKKVGVDQNQLYTLSGQFKAYVSEGWGEQAFIAEW